MPQARLCLLRSCKQHNTNSCGDTKSSVTLGCDESADIFRGSLYVCFILYMSQVFQTGGKACKSMCEHIVIFCSEIKNVVPLKTTIKKKYIYKLYQFI